MSKAVEPPRASAQSPPVILMLSQVCEAAVQLLDAASNRLKAAATVDTCEVDKNAAAATAPYNGESGDEDSVAE